MSGTVNSLGFKKQKQLSARHPTSSGKYSLITTSTDIRFAIDRLFRERDIEIAFPQRDIHIRSVIKDKKLNEKIEDKDHD